MLKAHRLQGLGGLRNEGMQSGLDFRRQIHIFHVHLQFSSVLPRSWPRRRIRIRLLCMMRFGRRFGVFR